MPLFCRSQQDLIWVRRVKNLKLKFPQFFNFVGSNAGNNASPMSVGLGSAVNKTNVAATPSMRPKYVPNTTPEIQCEKEWYISPFDGKKKMTSDHPALLEQERAKLERIAEEESSTTSPDEDARISAEVREVMAQKFGAGQRQLGFNPVMQNSSISSVADSKHKLLTL